MSAAGQDAEITTRALPGDPDTVGGYGALVGVGESAEAGHVGAAAVLVKSDGGEYPAVVVALHAEGADARGYMSPMIALQVSADMARAACAALAYRPAVDA